MTDDFLPRTAVMWTPQNEKHGERLEKMLVNEDSKELTTVGDFMLQAAYSVLDIERARERENMMSSTIIEIVHIIFAAFVTYFVL